MATIVPIEAVGHDLKHLLEYLHLGETITLVSSEGMPLAVIVSLQPAPAKVEPLSDWEDQWDALARKVSRAWKSDKSAVETLTEMRR